MAVPLVDRHVQEGRGNRPALRLERGNVSYAALQALVNRAGNALRDSGMFAEQRVAILLPDGPEFVAAFIGAMKIGAVPVPMNTAAPQPELELMLEDSRARALVVDERLVGAVGRGVPTRLVVGASFAGRALPADAPAAESRALAALSGCGAALVWAAALIGLYVTARHPVGTP